MARTIIGVNDAKAIKKWSGVLAYDTSHKSYFNQRFMARGAEAEVPIQILTDLESDAGEQISYDLLAELKMATVSDFIVRADLFSIANPGGPALTPIVPFFSTCWVLYRYCLYKERHDHQCKNG